MEHEQTEKKIAFILVILKRGGVDPMGGGMCLKKGGRCEAEMMHDSSLQC